MSDRLATEEFIDAEPLLWPALWRHKWLIAAVTLLFGVAGFVVSSLQTETFTARAQLFLSDPATAGALEVGGPRGARYVAGQADFVDSSAVAERAAEVLGTTAADVSASVSATPSTDSNVIAVVAVRPTGSEAAAYANGVVASYEAARIDTVADTAKQAVADLESEITPVEQRIDELSATLAGDPNDAAAQAELNAAIGRLGALQTQVSQIAIAASRFGSGVQERDAAAAPSAPTSPSPRRDALLAAAVGLILATGLAWWRQTQSPLADDRHDPVAALDAPLLAEVPVFDGKKGGPRIAPSETAAADAFQLAISAIGMVLDDTPSPVLVVTSARPNDGKTLVALNLSAVAGSNGRPTLLVDADERARGLTLLAGATANTGLTDLAFRTDLALGDCIRRVAVGDTKFDLLTAGTKPHDTAGFFRSPGFRETVSTIRGRAELTLIDSPPVLALADTVNIASQADGVVMVVDRGTPMKMLRDARDRLDLAGVPIVGYIFNRAHLRTRGYGYGK